MRTTVRLDEALLRDAKRLANETNRTLTAVIEDALREALNRRLKRAPGKRIKLLTGGDGGLRGGVYLHDNAALRDLMDLPEDGSVPWDRSAIPPARPV